MYGACSTRCLEIISRTKAMIDPTEHELGNVLERVVREEQVDGPLGTKRARVADDAFDAEQRKRVAHVA